MKDLDAIIASEHAYEVFHGILDRIFDTKCRDLEPFESYSPRLSEGERIVVFVHGFICEVTNGGLSQFLSNSTGDYAEETRIAMHMIGAKEAAAALEDVRAVIFDGLLIPSDRETRCKILFAWEDEDEERAEAFFTRHELGWCEPVEDAIAGYIRSHREMFS